MPTIICYILACLNVGDLGSIPGLGRYPGVGHGDPLQYSCLENLHGLRRLAAYNPWGCRESDMTERLSITQHNILSHTSHTCYMQSNILLSTRLSATHVYHIMSFNTLMWWIKQYLFFLGRRKWQPTPVFLPGESQGQRSLVVCCLWGCTESDTTEVT